MYIFLLLRHLHRMCLLTEVKTFRFWITPKLLGCWSLSCYVTYIAQRPARAWLLVFSITLISSADVFAFFYYYFTWPCLAGHSWGVSNVATNNAQLGVGITSGHNETDALTRCSILLVSFSGFASLVSRNYRRNDTGWHCDEYTRHRSISLL